MGHNINEAVPGRLFTRMAGCSLNNRSRRVTVLVLGVIILSVADLIITLAYLRAQLMMEANPIAAYLIESTHSAWALAGFKALTVGVCVAVLYRLRRYLAGELAAWLAVAILAGMSVIWHSYSTHFEGPGDLLLAQVDTVDDLRFGLP